MRVIAGCCRGKKLLAPPGTSTRPTSDRVKESLFNIVANHIDFSGINVLDICAGTGGLGIEALSRGAASCCFVENGKSVKTVLEKNISNTGFTVRSEIVFMDAVNALKFVAGRHKKFDLIFFDPPYASDLYSSVPGQLDSLCLAAPGSVLVIECSTRNRLPEAYGHLKQFDRRIYGDTAIELFCRESV